ncbi:MAG: alpha/beta fold hydrolase [Candidatus Eisenbacteria bacterium]
MPRIESLLSARLFVSPQIVGDRIFFISNMSGHLSLYAMDAGGSVPEPLLPPDLALQNPHLLEGLPFCVLPRLDRILVMIDQDGDENYQPMYVPVDGGFPEPALPGLFDGRRAYLTDCDTERNVAYFFSESRTESSCMASRVRLETGRATKLAESKYGAYPMGSNEWHTLTAIVDVYGAGDHVLYIAEEGVPERRRIFGTPLEDRAPDHEVKANSITSCSFVDEDGALLFRTSLWSDTYGLGLIDLAGGEPRPVSVRGEVHRGVGELGSLRRLAEGRYVVGYNIDGCSWHYEGTFDASALTMSLTRVLCGEGELEGGVLESLRHDSERDRFVLSFSSATSPTQVYTLESGERSLPRAHTRERILGVGLSELSSGEDASFESFDGLRVSARLYLPASGLGYAFPRPLVYYIHGGPQSQERPDFAWFSMPLIQFLTLSGFAVFVPNVRGSTGYGFEYMRLVQRDWGGDDVRDHVHAMTEVLPADARLDTGRAGVVGRSYGGYMTLTLASRHPELWAAAVDMFGPYDLPGFAGRVPEAWKPWITFMVGDPETEHAFLTERSPATYIDSVSCPLLVIQGKNDPRVLEVESRELVERLKGLGKDASYLMFEDEGHDVLKYGNRVTCYNAITDFFTRNLRP